MVSLMMSTRRLINFGLMKLIEKSSPLGILCVIISDKRKRSCQADVQVLGKLNRTLVIKFDSLKI